MENNKHFIDERRADLGDFSVGRLLPIRKKRQVGPFTFIDHMGPAKMGNGKYMEVDQHPHIGLSTLTYLFEGEIEHRDSIGSVQVIKPGDVGFMTAGKAITHTERTPENKRGNEAFVVHGYQIWVALPRDKENIEPKFEYYPGKDIPKWRTDSLAIKLIAGNAFGKSAPLQGYSPLFMVDIYAEKGTTLNLKNQIKGEVAIVIVKGSISHNTEKIEERQMLINNCDELSEFTIDQGTQLLLLGGEPLTQEHFLLWNFVSHSKEKLYQAKEDWKNKKFPKVPGDETYVPFPEK